MKDTQAWAEHCKALAAAIVEVCARTPVAGGPGALVKALASALPEWNFRHALARGGWYRLGGVVAADGTRVHDRLEEWAEDGLAAHGGDLQAFADEMEGSEFYATRLVGQTHYLVAAAGDGADNFLQLEIEDLQEMRAHRLFSDSPASLEELVDPRAGGGRPQPLDLPFYSFRRLQHVGSFLRRMLAQKPEPAPIHRMLADWSNSSAGGASNFHNHWVIATREHLDRYQQPVFRAQPIATLAGAPPTFAADPGANGLTLHEALARFDREAGYPMAWYFHMLAGRALPHWVAQAVVEDAMNGFAYLPQRDADTVRQWLHRPYAV
ncbi:MAG: hypothetical protein FIB06_01705 [Betaproteobacteria bacterium]|nr:hypothetical protein [Betaproteobacteria bacterium]